MNEINIKSRETEIIIKKQKETEKQQFKTLRVTKNYFTRMRLEI